MTIQVPGYTIQRLLGKGGMASVYLATQKSLDRPVALKVLKQFDTEAQVRRFFNEGKIIASLNQRNIITIHDLGEVNSRCFLAMEYLEGGDLRERIDAGLAADEALRLIGLIAHSLAFVHQKGIIHRDIKPENILFRKDGSPVLTDFGVAKRLQSDTSLTMDGSAIGSPHYISPEQAKRTSLDPRTDIYSLGIIFYELLTGQKPFPGNSAIEIIMAHFTTEAAPLPSKLARYQTLLDRMIAKDVGDRFESATVLLEYLAQLSEPIAKVSLPKSLLGVDSIAENVERRRNQLFSPVMRAAKFLNNASAYGLAFLITLPAGAYLYLAGRQPATEHNVARQSPALSALEIGTTQAIERLLTQAEAILAERKLTLPSLQRAHSVYEQILRLDPANTEALAGINRIQLLDGDIRQEIVRNLNQADKAIRAYRLTSPANNNAMLYFQNVLLLDPDNPEAGQGRFRVVNAYADLIEANLEDFEYDKARSNLDKGLSIDPASTRLLALKNQTNALIDAPKRLFGKIKSLLD